MSGILSTLVGVLKGELTDPLSMLIFSGVFILVMIVGCLVTSCFSKHLRDLY